MDEIRKGDGEAQLSGLKKYWTRQELSLTSS